MKVIKEVVDTSKVDLRDQMHNFLSSGEEGERLPQVIMTAASDSFKRLFWTFERLFVQRPSASSSAVALSSSSSANVSRGVERCRECGSLRHTSTSPIGPTVVCLCR